MVTSHEDVHTRKFVAVSCWIFLRMRHVSDETFRENQNKFYDQ
jgi:hypothetical protein